MEDAAIVALYHARNPAAVERTQEKYARYLYTVAYNILADRFESEETVNDTYVKAWHSMPPQAPQVLSTYLSRLARGAAIDRLRAKTRQKRSAFVTALSELAADFPAAGDTQSEAELRALAAAVEAFLYAQKPAARTAFVMRYYYGDSLSRIAAAHGTTVSQVKSLLHRTRTALFAHLQKEGLLS